MSGMSRSRVAPLRAENFCIVRGSHSSYCARLTRVAFRNPGRLLATARDSHVASLIPGFDFLCASATSHDGFSSRSQPRHLTTHRLWAAAARAFSERLPRISIVAARDDPTSRATASLPEKIIVAEQSADSGIKPLTVRREKTPRMWAGIGFQTRARHRRRRGSNRGGSRSIFETPPRSGAFMEGCGSSEDHGGTS